jgi:hypothetical protein
MDSDEDSITGLGRYGTNSKKIDELYRKKPKFEPIRIEDSSSSSDSSSHTSNDATTDEEVIDEENEVDFKTKKIEEEVKRQLQAAGAYSVPRSQTDKYMTEISKLKSTIQELEKQTEQSEDDDDVDEDEEEDEEEEKPQPRVRRVLHTIDLEDSDEDDEVTFKSARNEDDDDDIEILEGDEDIDDDEEEDEDEDENDKFEIKFKFENKVTTITTKKTNPFNHAMKQFLASHPGIKVIFKFDDEKISPDETPEDKDMDSGDQIDVYRSK